MEKSEGQVNSGRQVSAERPLITQFKDPVEFVREQLNYRRKTERGFSILSCTRGMRRVSPTLVSLILQGKRRLTLDRAEEFAMLMRLTAREKALFREMIFRTSPDFEKLQMSKDLRGKGYEILESIETERNFSQRDLSRQKKVSLHLLNDWVNVYVKDCFELDCVQKDPEKMYEMLSPLVSRKRLEKSLQFLLKEGYLRRTIDKRLVPESPLMLAETPLPSEKIRAAQKAALKIAQDAIELYGPNERFANLMIMSLDQKSYGKLVELIQEFSDKIQNFASNNKLAGERLYQVVLNLSPAGRSHQ